MANRPSPAPFGVMNRRTMLGTSTALLGGAVASACGQGPSSSTPAAAQGGAPAINANLNPPEVAVQGGRLRGLREGRTYSFLGIPYAQAERFGSPRPAAAWDGVASAQAWGPVCPHPPQTSVSGDELVFPHRYWIQNEDCQYLNVWTQNFTPATPRPVMVWMHGGGFTNGASMEAYAYDGRSLSEFGDVVVVSVNHRLNILGTLDLSAYGAEYANSRYTGTEDLVAALQWVQDNIAAFGGDPGNVMIFGQSGGGGKVVRMLHMPAASGLFHKVAAQSGGNNSYRTSDPAESIRQQQAIAAHTLRHLNLTGSQIDRLKQVPYLELIEAGNAARQSAAEELGVGSLGWTVIADDRYVMREFTDYAHGVPLMAGAVFAEFGGTLQTGDQKNDWNQQEIDTRLTDRFGGRANDVVTEFQQAFPHMKTQDALYYAASSRPGVKNLLSRKLEQATTPVYNYMYTWEYPINGGTTAFHCGEIAFHFHALDVPQNALATGGGPEARALQDQMAQAWVNFATSGNPSQPGLEWNPWSPDDPQAMIFDTVSESRALRDDRLVSLITITEAPSTS
jgi:para-nitrobenzyl esterase